MGISLIVLGTTMPVPASPVAHLACIYGLILPTSQFANLKMATASLLRNSTMASKLATRSSKRTTGTKFLLSLNESVEMTPGEYRNMLNALGLTQGRCARLLGVD